jgi:Rap guanine nucleotide exchange factor 1
MGNFITLAQHLRKLNNFNTTFAILAGLELSAIFRLKLLEKLPKAKQKMYSDLIELMNSKSSFKNYRSAVSESTPPLIPYL